MKLSRPYIYLGLALITAAVVWFLERPTEQKTGDVLNRPLFENLDAKEVSEITIEHLLNGVQLKMEEGEWKVSNFKTKMKESLDAHEKRAASDELQNKWYAADTGTVGMALDSLLDVDALSLAGDNPQKHGFFETNDVGMHIKLFDKNGKILANFFLGKAGPAFLEGYIRKEGENEVYLTNRFLRPNFPATVDNWRDHKFWDTAAANITGLQVEEGKKTFSLKKTEGKWPSPEVLQLIEQLSKVTAVGFAEPETKEMGFDKPTLKMTLSTVANPYVLTVGRQNASHQYYARKGNDLQIYLISDAIVNAILGGHPEQREGSREYRDSSLRSE